MARSPIASGLGSNTGSTTGFAKPIRVGSSWKTSLIVGAGDLNGDGGADLIGTGAKGEVWLHASTGLGGTKPFSSSGRSYLDKGRNKYTQTN